jgi:hypothetical protein
VRLICHPIRFGKLTRRAARQVGNRRLLTRRFLEAWGTKKTFQLIAIIDSRFKTVEISLLALDFPDQFSLGLAKRIDPQFLCHHADFLHFHRNYSFSFFKRTALHAQLLITT